MGSKHQPKKLTFPIEKFDEIVAPKGYWHLLGEKPTSPSPFMMRDNLSKTTFGAKIRKVGGKTTSGGEGRRVASKVDFGGSRCNQEKILRKT